MRLMRSRGMQRIIRFERYGCEPVRNFVHRSAMMGMTRDLKSAIEVLSPTNA